MFGLAGLYGFVVCMVCMVCMVEEAETVGREGGKTSSKDRGDDPFIYSHGRWAQVQTSCIANSNSPERISKAGRGRGGRKCGEEAPSKLEDAFK